MNVLIVEDGLISATDHCYDAIILDINLPDSDDRLQNPSLQN